MRARRRPRDGCSSLLRYNLGYLFLTQAKQTPATRCSNEPRRETLLNADGTSGVVLHHPPNRDQSRRKETTPSFVNPGRRRRVASLSLVFCFCFFLVMYRHHRVRCGVPFDEENVGPIGDALGRRFTAAPATSTMLSSSEPAHPDALPRRQIYLPPRVGKAEESSILTLRPEPPRPPPAGRSPPPQHFLTLALKAVMKKFALL